MIQALKKFFFEEMDLTSGNLFKKIGLFSLPVFLTTILQLLYSTVDLVTVHFLGGGENSMAAVAANGVLINLVIIVFSNMSLGSNVSAANAKGANDKEKAERILHTSFLFSIFTGVLVGVVGYFVSRPLLVLMNTSDYLLDSATLYLKIYFVGLPFVMVYNYLSQILRAIGDSSTPFFALFISGVINVIFDILFVTLFNMDVDGVAWATVLSEFISALFVTIVFFVKKNSYINLSFKKMKISKDALLDIIKLGLPAGLQGFFFALPNVFIQTKLYEVANNNEGITNGAIASSNIESYIYAGIEAIYSACMSFTAQNYGAKKKENIKKSFNYSLIWMFIYCAFTTILILTCHKYLLGLYVDSEDALKAGKDRLYIVGLTYVIDGIMDISSGSLRGCRKSVLPMITTFLGCTLLRIILLETALNIEIFHTVLWLYSVYPISWVLTSVANVTIWKIEEKKIYASFEENVNIKTLKNA